MTKTGLFAMSMGIFINIAGGVREVIAQNYVQMSFWEATAIVMRQAAEDGLLIGAALGLLTGLAALVPTIIFRRPSAGWVAAGASWILLVTTLWILNRGFAANFSRFFPMAYASAPGISSQTVFWIFLPPLIRSILTIEPWDHWPTIVFLAGPVLCGAWLLSCCIHLVLRRVLREPRLEAARLRNWLWLPAVSLGAAALCISAPTYASRGEKTPDVILISIDTLRADAVGCYGAAPSPTPRLDEFAGTADRFERVYAPSSWTIPSHAGLLTGLRNERHGARTMDTRLSNRILTLAERFTQKGYDTAAFVNSFMLSPRYGFGQGFAEYEMLPERPGAGVVRQAESWLEVHQAAPVFLFVHLFDPHWPYGPPESEPAGAQAKSFHEFVTEVLPAAEPVRQAWRERYQEEIRQADQAVGRLFEALKKSGRWEGSWVIVASDHGEEWWDHEFLGHAITLYDEMLRVPLMIKAPGQRTGKIFTQPVSLLDLPVTLTAGLDLPGPRDFDGQALDRETPNPREFTASDEIWGERRASLIQGCEKCINSYKWRFGAFQGARTDECFDLCNDPREETNLAHTEKGQALLARLKFIRAAGDSASMTGVNPPPPQVRERLRSLGYLE